MPSISYTLARGDDEFELDIEYSVAPFDPGCSSGPPEFCEPPSGGEIEELEVVYDGERFALTREEEERVTDWLYRNHDYSEDREYAYLG